VFCVCARRLLPEKKLILVNAMVRLNHLAFDRSPRGNMGTRGEHGDAVRTRGRGGLEILSEDYHNEIECSL
jgi:hypothetical protein